MSSEPLFLTQAYSPWIEMGNRDRRVEGYQVNWSSLPTHQLIAVEEGLLKWQGESFSEGEVLLLEAGQRCTLEILPEGRATILSFSCFQEEKRWVEDHQSWMGKRADFPREGALAGWVETYGVDLPLRAPEHLKASLWYRIRRMGDLWWRGERELLMADAILAAILAEWTQETLPGQGGDPIELAESAARHLLCEGVTVEDMAREAGLSLRSFHHRYREKRGFGPGAYLDDMRMERAKVFLQRGDQNLEETARICGWRSASAMSHRFKTVMGLSPGEYRRRFRSPGG